MSSAKHALRRARPEVADVAPARPASSASAVPARALANPPAAAKAADVAAKVAVAEPAAPTTGLLLLNLTSDVEAIYRDTLGRLLGPAFAAAGAASTSTAKGATAAMTAAGDAEAEEGEDALAAGGGVQFFVDDQQSATLLITLPNAAAARRAQARLSRTALFGARPLVTCVPTQTLRPSYVPCAVRITEMLPPASVATEAPAGAGAATSSASLASRNAAAMAAVLGADAAAERGDGQPRFNVHQLHQYLAANPGYLSVSRVAALETAVEDAASAAPRRDKKSAKNAAAAVVAASPRVEGRVFVATYADSGAALQARALMSGRAFHGVHLLFERLESESGDGEGAAAVDE
jgi:hypothetical protein